MHRGISSPGPPTFGEHLECTCGEWVVAHGCSPPQHQIRGWECIGLTEGTERDILRCPVADARQIGKSSGDFFYRAFEADFSIGHRTRQRLQGNNARSSESKTIEICGRKLCGRWKEI